MAKEAQSTKRLPVTLHAETLLYLDDLKKIGTHGSSIPGVARTLIEQGIRDAIEKGYIQQKGKSEIKKA